MSVARVKTSRFAARKGAALRCQRCQREIAKGEVYRWWFKGFRSRFKHVRCLACPAPRMSELESSNKAEAYAAVEAAEDELGALAEMGEASDLDQILAEAVETVRGVAEQYRDADESFGGGGATVSGEIADEMKNAADELEQFQAEEFDDEACEAHESEDLPYDDGKGTIDTPDALAEARLQCDDCQALRQQWWDEQVSNALDALTSVSL